MAPTRTRLNSNFICLQETVMVLGTLAAVCMDLARPEEALELQLRAIK